MQVLTYKCPECMNNIRVILQSQQGVSILRHDGHKLDCSQPRKVKEHATPLYK